MKQDTYRWLNICEIIQQISTPFSGERERISDNIKQGWIYVIEFMTGEGRNIDARGGNSQSFQ